MSKKPLTQPLALSPQLSALSRGRTLVMGILNVTPDSFSDGGKFLNARDAMVRTETMIAEGVDVIDVGGVSTRPGATAVPVDEERRRVEPVLRELRRAFPDMMVSLDTYRSEVARMGADLGVHVINDVTGLRGDGGMAGVITQYTNLGVILMHVSGGNPLTVHDRELTSDDVMRDVVRDLKGSLAIAGEHGIGPHRCFVDPGIGFGKNTAQNLEILRRLDELSVLGVPIVVGPSRKRFIGQTLDLPVEDRVEGTLAAVAIAVWQGAAMVRVHDVKAAKRVVRLVDAVKGRG